MSYPVILPTIGNALAEEIDNELVRAKRHGDKFASMHEAHSVILEELEEFWEITMMKRRDRDPEAIRMECVQIAAMAIKAIHSMDNFVGGNV